MTTTSRKACRSGARCLVTNFVEAGDCLGHHSENTIAQMAERIGKPASYLRQALSQYDDTHPLRGDLIAPLTLASADQPRDRNLALPQYISRACGGLHVPLPIVSATDEDVLTAYLEVVRESGEDAQAIQEALEDGRIRPDEADRVSREIDETIATLFTMKALINRKVTRQISIKESA